MDKAAVLVSFLSLIIASMNLSLSIILAKKNKGGWSLWNIVLAATLLAMAVFYSLNLLSSFLFSGIPLIVLNYVFEAFFIIDTSFVVVFICRFVNWLIACPMNKIEIVSTFIVGILYFIVSVLSSIINYPLLSTIQPLLATLNVCYCITVTLISRKTISNALVRDALFVFFIVTLTTIPLLVISSVWYDFRQLAFSIIELAYFIVHLTFMFISMEKAENRRQKEADEEIKLEDLQEFHITEREFEVIKLIKKGMTNKEIGYELGISVNTVNNHIANIFQKTGVKSRIDLLNVLKAAFW